MLRLLFCSAALLPIAVIPWFTSEATTIEATAADVTYAELVREPNIEALSDCDTGELPIFFHDNYVTTHSAEFIQQGLSAADGCGELDVVIVPVLPEFAESDDFAESVERTAELREMVLNNGLDVTVASEPIQDDASALYVNGRAAILRIEPEH